MKSTGKAESAFEDSGYTVGEVSPCAAAPFHTPALLLPAAGASAVKGEAERRIVIFYSVWGSEDRAHANFILEADLLIFLWLCRS